MNNYASLCRVLPVEGVMRHTISTHPNSIRSNSQIYYTYVYRILYKLSFNIFFIKQVLYRLLHVVSFMFPEQVYIEMTKSVRLFLFHDFIVCMDLSSDMLSTCFSHVASMVKRYALWLY